MELENVLLSANIQNLQSELEKTRKELEKTKRLEHILKNQVNHLLRFAYSEDNSTELAEKQKEINRLRERNRELLDQIQFIQQKKTKLRL